MAMYIMTIIAGITRMYSRRIIYYSGPGFLPVHRPQIVCEQNISTTNLKLNQVSFTVTFLGDSRSCLVSEEPV